MRHDDLLGGLLWLTTWLMTLIDATNPLLLGLLGCGAVTTLRSIVIGCRPKEAPSADVEDFLHTLEHLGCHCVRLLEQIVLLANLARPFLL